MCFLDLQIVLLVQQHILVRIRCIFIQNTIEPTKLQLFFELCKRFRKKVIFFGFTRWSRSIVRRNVDDGRFGVPCLLTGLSYVYPTYMLRISYVIDKELTCNISPKKSGAKVLRFANMNKYFI